MSRSSTPPTGPPIEQLRAIVEVLETPALARIYEYTLHGDGVTVGEIVDDLEIPQGTAYEYVRKLEAARLLRKRNDERPRRYEAEPVSLTLSADDETRTITPELIAAIARRSEDEDLDVFVDRHGIDGLAIALEYAREFVDGTVNHRIAARELDLSPLEAEIVLQALEPIVLEHRDHEE